MGSVVTFYSYKGGVGRSMALANIAVLLAQAGKRVLVVDWDLEAPGLERYFQYFPVTPNGAGLLPMLAEVTSGRDSSYHDYTWSIDVGSGESITFLPSGREQDPVGYAGQLESFDWNRFFGHGGGDYLEELRRNWKKDFDIVLIDSRTGLSDAGGVCTIQLPDIVIVMFTANDQSMLGARDVMRYVRKARQSLAYPRMELTVFPLPARFSAVSEVKEAQKWIDRFSEEFEEFYDDWLPSWALPREVLQKVKVPQVDFFGFGEKLPVVEQGVSDPSGMGYVYDLVARVLEDDFRAAHQILGLREQVTDGSRRARRPGLTEDYEWDLYISAPRLSYAGAVLENFVERLGSYLSEESGADAKIFWDRQEVVLGKSWPDQIKHALLHSRLLLPIFTPLYFGSEWNMAEWRTFEERERLTSAPWSLILPVVLRGSLPPDVARTRQFFSLDILQPGDLKRPTKKLTRTMRDIAIRIAQMLDGVPPFSPTFPLVDPANVDVSESKPQRMPWQGSKP